MKNVLFLGLILVQSQSYADYDPGRMQAEMEMQRIQSQINRFYRDQESRRLQEQAQSVLPYNSNSYGNNYNYRPIERGTRESYRVKNW